MKTEHSNARNGSMVRTWSFVTAKGMRFTVDATTLSRAKKIAGANATLTNAI